MDTGSGSAGISDAEWAEVASHAQLSPDDLRTKYEAALAGRRRDAAPYTVNLGARATTADDCVTQSFDISLLDVIAIKGTVTFCYTSSSDWSAQLAVELQVAGATVWSTTYTLSPSDTKVCWQPSLFLVKADFCIEITGPDYCVSINGDACYWDGSWECANFNEQLFCFD